MLRTFAFFVLSFFLVAGVHAEEAINQFDVDIQVDRGGDIVVTETITVTAEGREIRRGILRDLPRYYEDAETGGRLPFRYKVLSVKRDGKREPYEVLEDGNSKTIRIGDADYFLPTGRYTYSIQYSVKNQVRYFDDYDEVYWNATGTYWVFPIEAAQASITLPPGARIVSQNGYTGSLGQSGSDYRYQADGDTHTFTATRSFNAREGLTVSLAFEKGLIAPPSSADKGWLWWSRNGALAVLGASLLGLFGFYYRNFDKVGRDPVKGPVFARYAPPEGYSPAAAHHIYYRGFRGHKGLVATLMQLAAKGYMSIDVDAKDKKKTTLTANVPEHHWQDMHGESRDLHTVIFAGRSSVQLGVKYDSSFTAAYTAFNKRISDDYGSAYFKWNIGYVIVGASMSLGALGFAITQANQWTGWHTAAILGLVALNGLFMYLMPAPTRKGQAVRTEIEGFRLYLETAEKLQLNAVEVGSGAPPPMTVARYETFLPYAVALGVEKPWTKHFERLIPEEAAGYNPAWTNMGGRSFGSIGGMTDRMVSGMSSGVSSAMPQSSGSSGGGGGGGSSGGGGGGGGGGGW